MKLLIYLILMVILFLYVARTTISMNPFRVSLERPMYALGVLVLAVGISTGICLISESSKREGYKRAQKDIMGEIKKVYEEDSSEVSTVDSSMDSMEKI